jgi:hypothetical protein
LPTGREFIISSAWSQDEANLVISIYDVQSGSSLGIRGDGCEMSRFVREAAADAVFDEMVQTMEVASKYVCPAPFRRAVEPDEVPEDPSQLGRRGLGGELVESWSTLPFVAQREFVMWTGLADPGGGFTGIYDIDAQSFLFLGADGCEMSRRIGDPIADSVFDQIVSATQVPAR